jgi:hypothetical protein
VDPNDGELCLRRAVSEETRMEACSGTDEPVVCYMSFALVHHTHRFSCVKPSCEMKVLAGISAPATDQSIERGLSKSISVWTLEDLKTHSDADAPIACLHPTRLEAPTKESNSRASSRVSSLVAT